MTSDRPCGCHPGTAESGWHEIRSDACRQADRELWRQFIADLRSLRLPDTDEALVGYFAERLHDRGRGGDSITCPECGVTSRHPQDIEEGYCFRCHWWTSRPDMIDTRRRRPCPDRTLHDEHEWFDDPPIFRLECPGRPARPVRTPTW